MRQDRLIERQDLTNVRPQAAGGQEAADLDQGRRGDVDEHEQGAHAPLRRARLVRLRHRRDQDAARPQDREGALEGLAADEVDDGVHLTGHRFEARGAEVDRLLGSEVADADEIAAEAVAITCAPA